MITKPYSQITSVPPPCGARVDVRTAEVYYGMPWEMSVESCSDASANSPIMKVGNLYQPPQRHKVWTFLVLLNYPEGTGREWDEALVWAAKAGFDPTIPQEVFALGTPGQQIEELGKDKGACHLALYATKPCQVENRSRAVTMTRWRESHQSEMTKGANLWLPKAGLSHEWFVFRVPQ